MLLAKRTLSYPSTADLPKVPRKRVWGLPITHPAYHLSCYFESSSLCSVLSKAVGLSGHLHPTFLGNTPFWPSSIGPLNWPISYSLIHVRCSNQIWLHRCTCFSTGSVLRWVEKAR